MISRTIKHHQYWVLTTGSIFTKPIKQLNTNTMWGHCGRDCMVVGFITTCVISVYHHESCAFEHRSWRYILDATLSLSVTWDQSVVFSGYSGYLHQENWPPRLLKVTLNTITPNSILCAEFLNLFTLFHAS